MSLYTHEHWTQQLNEWNGIEPKVEEHGSTPDSFGTNFELEDVPEMPDTAEVVALDAATQVLFWRAETEHTPVDHRVEEAAEVDPLNIIG